MPPYPPQGGRAGWRRRAPLAVLLSLTAVAAALPGAASAATLSATPSNLGSVFSSAQPGDTILLASGSYGQFSGGAKSGMVTLRPQSGASASMSVSFGSSRNITLDGLTITNAYLSGSTRDIAIQNSTFTGMTVVDTSSFNGNNITFDRDRFDGITACSQCYEGRLTVKGNNSNTATVGVKITNSHFGNGGGSDGVQIIGNATGVEVGPGNEFSGIKQGSYAAHVDSIQLYGSAYTKIVGNYFHDNDVVLMAPDGGDHEYIANNVMVGSGYLPAVQLGSHNATQFVHNTVRNMNVHADAKSSTNPSRNVVVSNNVFHNGSTNATGSLCSGCTVSYNLFSSSSQASGTNTVIGTPVYVGGTSPTTFAGYALAAGSPGKGNASDGTDRGINVSGSTAPAPAPAPAPSPTPTTDTTAPDTSITSGPSGTTVDDTPTFGFSSTESGSTFQCKIDAGTWFTCTSPYTTASLSAASHTFSVRAIDAAGNVDASPATRSFTVSSDIPASAVWTAPTGVVQYQTVTLDGTRSTGNGPLSCTWSFENQDGSIVWETITGCKITKAFQNADTKYVKLIVKDADGDRAVNRQSFAVARAY